MVAADGPASNHGDGIRNRGIAGGKNTSMRVLELISSGGFYGAESVLLTLSAALNKIGCESVVGVFENAHLPNLEVALRARQAGLDVEVFPCRGRFDRKLVRVLREFARRRGIGVVNTHGYKANLYAYAAFCRTGIQLIATCHNWTNQSRSLQLYARVDRFVLRRFSRVVAVSGTVEQTLVASGIRPGRVATIENGVDISRFPSGSSTFAREIGKGDRKLVGMIGRLVPEKGPDVFLRAARGALERFPDSLFLLVGDGAMRPELERLARELAIADHVIFTGSRNDMPEIYAALDIVVLPSLNEGLPMSLLEALAAERPAIAARVGGVPRIIRENETGILVNPGDVQGLREAIERLLADSTLSRRLARAGRSLVEREFSAEVMARRYLDLYQAPPSERSRLADEQDLAGCAVGGSAAGRR